MNYIKTIKVLKSSIPDFYFIYLELKNVEYANIFYNTFNYSKFNPIERDYLVIAEIFKVTFNSHFISASKKLAIIL